MIDERQAALVLEEALAAVFDPGVVARLREDSPLSTLGMTPADAVCVADAVAAAAERAGWSCRLGDDDLGSATLVRDLMDAIVGRSLLEESAP